MSAAARLLLPFGGRMSRTALKSSSVDSSSREMTRCHLCVSNGRSSGTNVSYKTRTHTQTKKKQSLFTVTQKEKKNKKGTTLTFWRSTFYWIVSFTDAHYSRSRRLGIRSTAIKYRQQQQQQQQHRMDKRTDVS